MSCPHSLHSAAVVNVIWEVLNHAGWNAFEIGFTCACVNLRREWLCLNSAEQTLSKKSDLLFRPRERKYCNKDLTCFLSLLDLPRWRSGLIYGLGVFFTEKPFLLSSDAAEKSVGYICGRVYRQTEWVLFSECLQLSVMLHEQQFKKMQCSPFTWLVIVWDDLLITNWCELG